MSNLKMAGVPLHECPEVEQLLPCVFFNTGKCPSCYAEAGHRLRLRNSRHVHKKTPKGGVVRLGTWREVLPPDWAAFKAGRGTWSCCRGTWERPDFPTRPYFMVTRGLSPIAFYRQVAEDPACVNLQVSVDLSPLGLPTPGIGQLAELVKLPKVILRAKSTDANAQLWAGLVDGLSIPRSRVMETPLRLKGQVHAYGRETPLERAGWAQRSFVRCNTPCGACVKENGLLGCVARPAALVQLEARPRPPAPRSTVEPEAVAWVPEARRGLAEMGGEARVRDLYAWFLREHPGLDEMRLNWQFRIRVAVQQVATLTPRGTWLAEGRPLELWASEP
jgi:hypothetical protein